MTTERRTCAVCGGDGWTDGSAELRRDGRTGDTTCLGCNGRGWVEVKVKVCAVCGVALHRGEHALTGEREWHDADNLGSSETPTFHDHEVRHGRA